MENQGFTDVALSNASRIARCSFDNSNVKYGLNDLDKRTVAVAQDVNDYGCWSLVLIEGGEFRPSGNQE